MGFIRVPYTQMSEVHWQVHRWLKNNCITVTPTLSMCNNSGELTSWKALCKSETVWLVGAFPLFGDCSLCLSAWEEPQESHYFLNLLDPVNFRGFWVLWISPPSRCKFQFRGDNYMPSTYYSGSSILSISFSVMCFGHWRESLGIWFSCFIYSQALGYYGSNNSYLGSWPILNLWSYHCLLIQCCGTSLPWHSEADRRNDVQIQKQMFRRQFCRGIILI